MKRSLTGLTQRYVSALRKHLQRGAKGPVGRHARVAHRLGREAVSLGLETLDVARIHDKALAELEGSHSRDGIIEQAEIFFTEAITPIEKTHHAALTTNVRLKEVHKTLGRRTEDLAVSNRSLKQGIARRKTVEKALKKSGKNSKTLLEESRRLQKHLQQLTHRIMVAQEDKRKKISHDLQDEIGQTLLGINVRLLALKREAAASNEGLEKEIASAQRVVDNSVKSIKRFAREFRVTYDS